MKCPKESVKSYGNFDTKAAKNLRIDFRRCDPTKRDDCATIEEQNEWMKSKFLLVLENRETYNQEEYNPAVAVDRSSRFTWYTFSPDV